MRNPDAQARCLLPTIRLDHAKPELNVCGIAAIFVKSYNGLPDAGRRLQVMAEAMRHRGPDDQGVYVTPDGRAGLANRRLAIRDLSPAGQMPMANARGDVRLTYNGEIYNAAELRTELERLGYHFQSRSDTEVILHGYEAWGEGIVPRLRGMFAFVVLDCRPSEGDDGYRALIARDHMGIKPLYYAESAEALVIASELKGLLASGLVAGDISPAGLVGYLLLGSVPTPLTIYEGAAALPAASLLRIKGERPTAGTPERYWQLPDDVSERATAEASVDEVREALAEAVRVRLVSDVPLGAFLSGGLDSSSVVALMRQATDGPIRTCSMVFEESDYSEGVYARSVAGALDADHYERTITAGDVMGEIEQILAAMDQPSIDGVNTYFVSQTARQAGLTVALSGLGGDELFGGYDNTFHGVPRTLRNLRLAHAVPGLGPAAARSAVRALTSERRWTKITDALSRPPSAASAYLAQRGLFAPSEVEALVTGDVWHAARELFDPVAHIAANAGPAPANGDGLFQFVSRAELRTYTQDQLLRDTDAMSMAHSLEVRVPLLDRRLVELVLRLPADHKRNGRAQDRGPKPLLAQAAGHLLPEVVRRRPDKQGFTFPFDRWLRGPLGDYLNGGAAGRLLRAGQVQAMYEQFRRGRLHWSRAWALAALNGWLERQGKVAV